MTVLLSFSLFSSHANCLLLRVLECLGRVKATVAIQFSEEGKWILLQRPTGATRPIHAWAELSGELMGVGDWHLIHPLSIEVNVLAWLHALQSFNSMHPLGIQILGLNDTLMILMRGQADEHAVEHQLKVNVFNSHDWQPSVPMPTMTVQLTEVSSISHKLQKLSGDKVWLKGHHARLTWTIPQTGLEAEFEQSHLPTIQSTSSPASAEVCLRRTDVIRAMSMWAVEAGAAPLMLSLVDGRAAIWMVTLGATQQLLDEEAPTGTLCMVLPHMILD